MLDSWKAWTSHALSTHIKWRREWLDHITEFREYVIRAVWPGTNPELESALKTLALYLVSARNVFEENCDDVEGGWVNEVRFYKRAEGSNNYRPALEQYEAWCDQQYSAIRSATKAANWVADVVRRDLNPMFFATEGRFVVTTGPDASLQWTTAVLVFTDEEKRAEPNAAEAMLKAILARQ